MRTSITHVALLVLLATLTACASTTVEFSGAMPASRPCQGQSKPVSAVVLWGPQWRPAQKDVPLREAAAEQGLKDYFANSSCFLNPQIRRVAIGTALNAEQVKQVADAAAPAVEHVVVIAVRELGPIVKLLSSAALIEGGTEVVLDVSFYSKVESVAPTDFTVHWKNGGPGVVKGVSTLPQDMGAALVAAFGR